jgi:murein DD-endopeptidase MepM/ murein hydrolase activator NlpD
VLAVADARVSDLRNGLPDNVGATERSSRVITVDSAVGNYVILDLGRGQFAVYAHLQPGSLKVKFGDHVNAGQLLALLGNSGNSDAPHLHFQLTDANSPMGSEGIPCELERFTQLGILGDQEAVLDNEVIPVDPIRAITSDHLHMRRSISLVGNVLNSVFVTNSFTSSIKLVHGRRKEGSS